MIFHVKEGNKNLCYQNSHRKLRYNIISLKSLLSRYFHRLLRYERSKVSIIFKTTRRLWISGLVTYIFSRNCICYLFGVWDMSARVLSKTKKTRKRITKRKQLKSSWKSYWNKWKSVSKDKIFNDLLSIGWRTLSMKLYRFKVLKF